MDLHCPDDESPTYDEPQPTPLNTALPFNFPDSADPEIGMEFQSTDDAYHFYLSYSCRKGFGVVRRSRHNFYGLPSDVTFSCNKEKKPLNRARSEGFKKRRNTFQGTCCPAKIVVKDHLLDGRWTITTVELDHNHDLQPDAVRYMRCHRVLPDFVKKQIEINDDSGIPQHRSFNSMFHQAGGYDNCHFTERDMRNHIQARRALKLAEGDANALMRYFRDRQRKCSNFFYLCETDDEGRLRNVFWADGRSRTSYKYFGDVITFDTTYLTNKYDMPFAPFVGVNHHGQSILLACALLADECTPTYEWLFNTFLVCMNGVHPPAIITDQCAAMCSAVATVFPKSRHRLCLWHIMKKVPHKAGSGLNKDQFIRKVCDLVYDSNEIVDFETGWLELIEHEKSTQALNWLDRMFSIRSQWVPIYVRKFFWAGMSTTQRSESMNSFFDGYVNSSTSLRDFVDKYELALQAKWEKERLEDFRSNDRSPLLVSMLNFEKQFSELYTHRSFYIFQDEVKGLISCHSQLLSVKEDVHSYEVVDAALGKSYIVLYRTSNTMYHCQCLLFQFKGFVCRHGLAMYRQVGINDIPKCYVLPRWGKYFIRSHTRFHIHNNNNVPRNLTTYDAVYTKAHSFMIDMIECTYRDPKQSAKLLEWFEKMALNVSSEKFISYDDYVSDYHSDSDRDSVSDPKKVKRLGRPRSTRFKTRVEIAGLKRKKQTTKSVSDKAAEVPNESSPNSYPLTSNTDMLMEFSKFVPLN